MRNARPIIISDNITVKRNALVHRISQEKNAVSLGKILEIYVYAIYSVQGVFLFQSSLFNESFNYAPIAFRLTSLLM